MGDGHGEGSREEAPSLTGTIGLHGSASTWVFNVVRELLTTMLGKDVVRSAYAETLAELPSFTERNGKHTIFKSHHGSRELDAWIATQRPLLILSVRDPRDAAISMSQRFNRSLSETLRWLALDCARMTRFADGSHLLLRYENHFFDDRNSVEIIAERLGIRCPPSLIDRVFVAYTTDAVRAFAQTVPALPPARLVATPITKADSLTQIHHAHIGDRRIGKWRDLAKPDQAALTQFYRPFLERFGYELV